jgi:hypothetical protein
MRTLFEDTDERADREYDQREKRLPIVLWALAVVLLAGAGVSYYVVTHRKPPELPPIAASLDDPTQINQTLNRFNEFVRMSKWDEAQAMLSTAALKRLSDEKKTLRESLLGENKDDKLAQTGLTPSQSRTPSTVRVDCVYFFDKQGGLEKIVPLTLIKENDRLVIDSW